MSKQCTGLVHSTVNGTTAGLPRRVRCYAGESPWYTHPSCQFGCGSRYPGRNLLMVRQLPLPQLVEGGPLLQWLL
jgi:hypothetical protein